MENNKNNQDMVIMGPKTIQWFLDVLRQQGLSFILLAIAIIWLNSQNVKQDLKYEKLILKYEACQSEQLINARNIAITNQKVINDNTNAMLLMLERLK